MITKNNYNKVLQEVTSENQSLSEDLLQLFQQAINGDVYLSSVGNSISAGYSKCDEIIPFLMRTELFKIAGSNYFFFSHARVRRNEDRLISKWYIENKTNEELTFLNIDDILAKKGKYVLAKWDDGVIDRYRDLSGGKVIGLQELNKKKNAFIIYNGMTGVFTNIWRKGNAYDKKRIFEAFKEDLRGFEFFLRQIYIDNPNTQVYVCGLPNIMGTGIISLLDRQIINVCEKFPNAIYVPGTIRNAFFYLDGQQEFDVHYSKPEYIILWNNILRAMINNYITVRLKSSILSRMEQYSSEEEKRSTTSKGNMVAIGRIIDEEIERYLDSRPYNGSLYTALQEIMRYYNDNYLSIFPCTPREDVLRRLDYLSNLHDDKEGSFRRNLILK